MTVLDGAAARAEMARVQLSEKRREAGLKGARARWNGRQTRDGGDEPGSGDHTQPDLGAPLRTSRPVAKLRQGRNDWYRIENRAAGTAEVFIYDEIGYFGVTAGDFIGELSAITAPDIELHLNTPGGDVFDGLAIYTGLSEHPARVTAIVDSLAASAGSFIFQAADRRVMTRVGQLMIHDAWGLNIGSAGDMRAMADLLDRQTDLIAGIYADRSGRSLDSFRELMTSETWFSADEAVEAGLADEVRGRGEKNTFDLSIYSFRGREDAPAPAVPDPASTEDDWDIGELTNSLKEAMA